MLLPRSRILSLSSTLSFVIPVALPRVDAPSRSLENDTRHSSPFFGGRVTLPLVGEIKGAARLGAL